MQDGRRINVINPGMKRGVFRIGWLLLAVSLAMGLWIFPLPGMGTKALANDSPLELVTQAGYRGVVKQNRWNPITLTLTNNGEDMQGELVLELVSPDNNKDIAYVVPMELPSGTTKTVTLAMPGMTLTKQNNAILFYEGGVKGGKRKMFQEGSGYLSAQADSEHTTTFGIVSRDPDTMNILALLTQKGYSVRRVPITTAELPEEAILLDSLDVLILNDVSSGEWSGQQIRAILDWVAGGGQLVLAGGVTYPKTAAAFDEWSPVEAGGTIALTRLSALEERTGVQLELGEPFTVMNGKLREGAVPVLMEGDVPIAAYRPHGMGRIWYMAYDLALQPVATWGGNASLWESLLSGTLTFAPQSSSSLFAGTYWDLNNALEWFPSMNMPTFLPLVLVLLVYALVAGPILYVVLKRFGKREYAWAVLPLLAVAVSIGIYGFGAAGRSGPMVQALGLTQLDGSGTGSERVALSVFEPKGGSYEVAINGSYATFPIVWQINRGIAPELFGAVDTYMTRRPESTAIRYVDVPYWSVRKMWLRGDGGQATGQFTYELEFREDQWSGIVTNGTREDLVDVMLLYQDHWVLLGDLKAGESTTFQRTAPSSFSTRSNVPQVTAEQIFPYYGLDDERHRRALLVEYLGNGRTGGLKSPVLIGWSRIEDEDWVSVRGRPVKAEGWRLWAQPVDLGRLKGESLYLLPGTVLPVVAEGADRVEGLSGPNSILAKPGTIVLKYTLPRLQSFRFDAIKQVVTSHDSPGAVTYEIWNESEQKWQPLLGTDFQDGGLSNYLVRGESLLVRLNVTDRTNVILPGLGFEGRVPHD